MANYKLHIYITYLDFLGCPQNLTHSPTVHNMMRLFELIPVAEFCSNAGVCCMIAILSDEKSNEVDLCASEDWDVKTVTSALKLYLR